MMEQQVALQERQKLQEGRAKRHSHKPIYKPHDKSSGEELLDRALRDISEPDRPEEEFLAEGPSVSKRNKAANDLTQAAQLYYQHGRLDKAAFLAWAVLELHPYVWVACAAAAPQESTALPAIRYHNYAHKVLRPGGELILGNFHPRNPDKALMDHVIDWRLIHRSEANMDRLYQNSAFGRGCTDIHFEESGVNLFAACVKG